MAALPIFSLLLAMVSVQMGAAFVKKLFPLLGPEGAATLRVTFAAIILVSIWRPWRKKIERTSLRWMIAYGLALGAMNLFFYLAIARIPLGLAVAIEFTGPLTVSILTSRKWVDLLWVALAATGIALILPWTGFTDPLDPLGLLYIFLAATCWALYIIFGQHAGRSAHSGTAASIGMMVAALLILPFGMAQAGNALLNFSLWPLALAIAVFSSALPYSLEMMALKRISANQFGIFMSLEPALAAVAGYLFLNERPTWVQCLAILMIMLASFGTSMSQSPSTAQITEA